MESKAADVFAFGMFAVEVFTGRIPFEEQKNEAVVLRILRGGRPEMPENGQAVGLTDEMWKLLESCWQENPRKRPAMEEVVRRLQRFVDDSNVATECVRITPPTRSSYSAPFLTSMIDPGNRHPGVVDLGPGRRPPSLRLGLKPSGPERRPRPLGPQQFLRPPDLERGLISLDRKGTI